MSVVVENESALPITVTEKDMLTVGVEEGTVPTLDACLSVQCQQEKFYRTLDWAGSGQDVVRVVPSPVEDKAIVLVMHRVPRFTACSAGELEQEWKGREPLVRITTLVYQEGDLDYIVEDKEKGGELTEWTRSRPWCGQTVFTFAASPPPPYLRGQRPGGKSPRRGREPCSTTGGGHDV